MAVALLPKPNPRFVKDIFIPEGHKLQIANVLQLQIAFRVCFAVENVETPCTQM